MDGDLAKTGQDLVSAENAGLVELAFKLVDMDIEVKKQEATRVPIDQITALGTAFAATASPLRTVVQTLEIPAGGLVEVLGRDGNPVDLGKLSRFKDTPYMMGSRVDLKTGFEQMRLREVGSQSAKLVTQLPADPTTLLIAATLMEVNKKLDAIQQTQHEMFEYLKNKDKAEQRANLEALSDVMGNFRFHWENETYRQNKHILVQDVRKDADQRIIHLRAQIKSKVGSHGFFHFDGDVDRVSREILEELKEYRLAVYLYSYASFLEVLLLGNFENPYLENVSRCIEERDIRYRELYTQCYEHIDGMSRGSVEQQVSGALAFAGKALGGFLSNTPIGDLTPLDSALADAGQFLEETKNASAARKAELMLEARADDVRPFAENIRKIDSLYNAPTALLMDEEAIYILPA